MNSSARKRSKSRATDKSAGSYIEHTDSSEPNNASSSKKQKHDTDLLVEQQHKRKREAKLKRKRKLEATPRASLKALCIISGTQGSGASDHGVETAPRGRGRPRGKASKEDSRGTGAAVRSQGGGASFHSNATSLHCHGPPLQQQRDYAATKFETGTLIRYAFQDEDKAWVWYVGMVTGAWRRQSWYKVVFEDGEQLWLRLDPLSQGRLWKDIKVTNTSAAVEMARFERNLEAASPVALEQLRVDLESCAARDSGAKKIGRCEFSVCVFELSSLHVTCRNEFAARTLKFVFATEAFFNTLNGGALFAIGISFTQFFSTKAP